MSADTLIQLGVELAGLAIAAGSVKADVRNLNKRVDELAESQKDLADSQKELERNLPRDYVPRTEVERALKAIDDTGKATHSMIQALVYSGGNRDAAQKGLR